MGIPSLSRRVVMLLTPQSVKGIKIDGGSYQMVPGVRMVAAPGEMGGTGSPERTF